MSSVHVIEKIVLFHLPEGFRPDLPFGSQPNAPYLQRHNPARLRAAILVSVQVPAITRSTIGERVFTQFFHVLIRCYWVSTYYEENVI